MHGNEANLVNALKSIIQLAILTLATAIQHRKHRPQRRRPTATCLPSQTSPLPPSPPPHLHTIHHLSLTSKNQQSKQPLLLPRIYNNNNDVCIKSSERNDTYSAQRLVKQQNQRICVEEDQLKSSIDNSSNVNGESVLWRSPFSNCRNSPVVQQHLNETCPKRLSS